MRHQYSALNSNEPQPLNERQRELVCNFLWGNFWSNLKDRPSGEIQLLMKKYILDLLVYQNADYDSRPNIIRNNEQFFSTMNPGEIQNLATHLYVAAQLVGSCQELYTNATKNGMEYASSIREFKLPGWDTPAFERYPHPFTLAFEQVNPYLLRVHVYHLFHRMQSLTTGAEQDTEHASERRAVTLKEVEKILGSLRNLANDKFPALAHLLYAYAHATLAMGCTDSEEAKNHWRNAYTQILWTEKVEHSEPRRMFLVNRGQDFYQALPHESLTAFKNEVTQHLGPDETAHLVSTFEKRLSNRN